MPRKTKTKKKKGGRNTNSLNSGLGRAIRNKYGGQPETENKAHGRVKRKDHVIDPFGPNMKNLGKNDDASKLKSITEVSNIQEFMDTLSTRREEKEKDDRENSSFKLITNDISETMEAKEIKFHQKLEKAECFDYKNLPIPRKPVWNKSIATADYVAMQRDVFTDWRRSLSGTAVKSGLEMTPFEKNIEVWKQLWLVVERSHLLILIVDARNPLAFISRDLFKYVSEVGNRKKQCLLLINKADYLSSLQRKMWSEYFESQNIDILYFSAMREQIRMDMLSKSKKEKKTLKQKNLIIDNVDENDDDLEHKKNDDDSEITANTHWYDKTHVLTVEELLNVFDTVKKQMKMDAIEVGMVGYPNVGKSSVINVLWGAKKVSVASTPGKTKHFQTLILREDIVLCDCPGLVFPTLMSSKSDLILNGVIPIDHLKDFIAPMRLMVHRCSIKQFNDIYNLKIPTNKKRIKFITVYDILDCYCHQQKMYNRSNVPNRNEAARILLKDFIKGKVVYCHYPPNLNSRNRYLFYNGTMLVNVEHENKMKKKKDKTVNILDQNKLHQTDQDMDVDVDDDSDGDELDDMIRGMTDEEFLELWKHPMQEYSEINTTTKRKKEKKARVLRKIEKRTQKTNRKYRRDSDNYATGSNAVVISSVPHIKAKHGSTIC